MVPVVLSEQLQELAARRATLEERTQMRLATASEFGQLRLKTLARTKSGFQGQCKIAHKRNEEWLTKIYEANDAFQKRAEAISSARRLSEQKARFRGAAERMYPAWQEEQMHKDVKELQRLERERFESEMRRAAAREAFAKELALKAAVEGHRRELALAQIQEHGDGSERYLRREKLQKQARETENFMQAEAARAVREALRGVSLAALTAPTAAAAVAAAAAVSSSCRRPTPTSAQASPAATGTAGDREAQATEYADPVPSPSSRSAAAQGASHPARAAEGIRMDAVRPFISAENSFLEDSSERRPEPDVRAQAEELGRKFAREANIEAVAKAAAAAAAVAAHATAADEEDFMAADAVKGLGPPASLSRGGAADMATAAWAAKTGSLSPQAREGAEESPASAAPPSPRPAPRPLFASQLALSSGSHAFGGDDDGAGSGAEAAPAVLGGTRSGRRRQPPLVLPGTLGVGGLRAYELEEDEWA